VTGLQKAGKPFAVASGADVHKMGITLGRSQLLSAFQGRMFGSDHVAHSKPAPDVYLFAAKALGVDPRRCAVVEDTPTGTRAGVAAGATVFAYAGAAHSDANALLAAGATAVFSEMAALPHLLGI
jgi:HAD superfamily hydrolase (TIGR01509 family)